ncbi:sporulation protein [Brevibacillus ruminantium]|uniref:Sporulation protein n=1 Tax=Brevibacillus ruminantium TaxID=2950604 RepID=A0ABY4WME9_9BACL|nr:sporulation protein [Brevibacillus ruminantium]USG67217.1 sporulation protein [Brevibacillus ruminantium]
MSLFKKLMASVGIGAAQVDARLQKDTLLPGEIVSGEVYIKGGDVSQTIDDIYMYVVTHYERETNDKTIKEEYILAKHQLAEKFGLCPREEKVIPFTFQLPYETPLTMGRQPVYLRTGLDIRNAVDPGDSDFIEVRPHPLMEKVLQALQLLGFQLCKVDCEYNRLLGRSHPFVQTFQFRPTDEYRNRVEELELVFYLKEHELEVLLELDKRARGYFGGLGLYEALNLDERYARLCLSEAERNCSVEECAAQMEELIRQRIR